MKKIWLTTVLVLVLRGASADQFQLKETNEIEANLIIAYAKVTLARDGSVVFRGSTDKLGRFSITGLPNGTYSGEIQDSQGRKQSMSLIVDGAVGLKTISVQ